MKMASFVLSGLLPVVAMTHDVKADVSLSVHAKINGFDAGGGSSVYVRWGSTTCPDGAETVYSGEVAGGTYAQSGAAANMLCLPLTPSYPAHSNNTVYVAEIFHVEYSILPDPRDDRHVVCAVCRVPRATNIMIPASVHCPCENSWTTEYTGYLMAGLPWSDRSSTEYICVDSSLGGEKRTPAVGSNYGILYHTKTMCNAALPCPPFEGKIAGCVVCSK